MARTVFPGSLRSLCVALNLPLRSEPLPSRSNSTLGGYRPSRLLTRVSARSPAASGSAHVQRRIKRLPALRYRLFGQGAVREATCAAGELPVCGKRCIAWRKEASFYKTHDHDLVLLCQGISIGVAQYLTDKHARKLRLILGGTPYSGARGLECPGLSAPNEFELSLGMWPQLRPDSYLVVCVLRRIGTMWTFKTSGLESPVAKVYCRRIIALRGYSGSVQRSCYEYVRA